MWHFVVFRPWIGSDFEPKPVAREAVTQASSTALRPPASNLVQGTGDVTIATDLGPSLDARGWPGKAPKVVVGLDVTDLRASELEQEVLELRRRVFAPAVLCSLFTPDFDRAEASLRLVFAQHGRQQPRPGPHPALARIPHDD